MPLTQPSAGAGATPTATQPGTSFREQTLARLRSESGEQPRQPEQPAPRTGQREPRPEPQRTDREDTVAGAAGEPEGDLEEQLDELPGVEDGEDAVEGEEDLEYGDDVPTLHQTLQERDAEIQRLSKREQELTRDYTRKTQAVAQMRRAAEGDAETIRNTARFLASKIDSPLRHFEQIDWNSLQTNDPAKYQTTRQQYEQTVRARNAFMGEIAQLEQAMEQQTAAARQREAQMGLEVLTSRIPGWSAERYSELRNFAAENYGYSGDELDASVDYRLMLVLNDLHASRKAATTVRKGPVKPAKQAPPQGQARPAFRNTGGQYQTAQQNLRNNPGDKQAARSFFQARLAAERKRSGG